MPWHILAPRAVACDKKSSRECASLAVFTMPGRNFYIKKVPDIVFTMPGRIFRGATRFHRSVFLESQLLRAYGTPTVPPPFVIRAIALLTHAGLVVKCISILTCKHVILAIRLTTLSNKNSSYPTSEYLPPICLISEYGNLFRYSYPLTQESRPQLLKSLSPGVSQTHSIRNSILSSTTDSSL